MSESIGGTYKEMLCYLIMIILMAIGVVNHELVPLHVNITVFSLAIIIVGSYRSLQEIIIDMKKVHILGSKKEDSNIETVSNKDAL